MLKEKQIEEEIKRVERTGIGACAKVQKILEEKNSTLLKSSTTLGELIRRPELSYEDLESVDEKRPPLPQDVREQVNINIKYSGYLKRQKKQVEQFKKWNQKGFRKIWITIRLKVCGLKPYRN